MNRKVELRAEAEIQADIAIVQLEMDLEQGYQARMNAVLRAFMLAKKAGAV